MEMTNEIFVSDASSESPEKLSCDAWCVFHVFTHYSHCREVPFLLDTVYFSHPDFLGEFL